MNSKSDIVDELNIIKGGNVKTTKTLNDIIDIKVKNIENAIDNRVIDIYARPWTKLEPKLKLRKLNEYLDNSETVEYDTETKTKILKYYLDKKKVNVNYNCVECLIENIKVNC
tara:strand:+ start:576 stop:914 length:339 start_codon:yes stop_codon:yes gene_type:complete